MPLHSGFLNGATMQRHSFVGVILGRSFHYAVA